VTAFQARIEAELAMQKEEEEKRWGFRLNTARKLQKKKFCCDEVRCWRYWLILQF